MNEQERLKALNVENQRLREELAQLDELPRKRHGGTVSDLKGVQDVHTGISKHVRSMPRAEDRYYLDLYLAQKERERLVKETTWVKKRRVRIGRRFDDIGQEVAELEEEAVQKMAILQEPADGNRPKAQGETPPLENERRYSFKQDEWKSMSVDY